MKTPDWDFWKDIEEVELWQAAFLANNVDPDTQRPPQRHYQPYNSRPRLPDGLHDEKVSKLLRKLIAKWQQGQFSSPPLVICSNSNFQRVNLSEVATCCIHMNHDIPQELVALSKKPDTSNVVKSESKQPYLNPRVSKTKNRNNQKIWDEAKLKVLLNESLQPGVTQKSLGIKYGVSRQRIGALIKQVKKQTRLEDSWSLPKLTPSFRISKGNKY